MTRFHRSYQRDDTPIYNQENECVERNKLPKDPTNPGRGGLRLSPLVTFVMLLQQGPGRQCKWVNGGRPNMTDDTQPQCQGKNSGSEVGAVGERDIPGLPTWLVDLQNTRTEGVWAPVSRRSRKCRVLYKISEVTNVANQLRGLQPLHATLRPLLQPQT